VRFSALVAAVSIAFIATTPAHAKGKKKAVKHKAPSAAKAAPAGAKAPLKHHPRFVGNGTGGDSPKPEGTGPELLLTFDDGPAPDKTPQVLDLLDKHGWKAVFFVCGRLLQGKGPAVERSRELLREMVRRGHAVGNHTIHHLFLCGKVTPEKVTEEIQGNGELIAAALGEPPYLFRTPYGAHCANLDKTLAALGVRPIGWDIDPQDWKLKNAAKIEATVKASLQKLDGRAILLLHDVQAATIIALPKIFDFIDEENARRTKLGQPPIKVIGYDYLLEERRPKTPLFDGVIGVALSALPPVWKELSRYVELPPLPPVPPPTAAPLVPADNPL
jgi:peptidoglycan/xylan/chitin deacetylase (PgdA/CDA1 family)